MARCFDSQHMTPTSSELRHVLIECLVAAQNLVSLKRKLADEDNRCFVALKKAGIIVEDADLLVRFSSPLAAKYYSKWLFPKRALQDPPSLRDLIRNVVGNMSASALQQSVVDATNFPKEATFQHQFMEGLALATRPTCSICPELSRVFSDDDQALRIDGEIDFYLSGLRWGIELLVNGDNIGERKARFAPDGTYAALAVSDYAVIDFRGSKTGEVTNVVRMEKRVTVFFQPSDFSRCRCIFGIDEAIYDFALKSKLAAFGQYQECTSAVPLSMQPSMGSLDGAQSKQLIIQLFLDQQLDSVMAHMTWSDNTQTPLVADILEALELTGPWSVFPNTTSNKTTPWTLAEHDKFVEGLRVYPQESAELVVAHSRTTCWGVVEFESIAQHIRTKRWHEVKSYGSMCWRSRAYQKIRTRRAALVTASTSSASSAVRGATSVNGNGKVIGAEPSQDGVKVEPGPFPLPPSEDEPEQAIAAWRKVMLEWCIQTLSQYHPRQATPTESQRQLLACAAQTQNAKIYAKEQTNWRCHVPMACRLTSPRWDSTVRFFSKRARLSRDSSIADEKDDDEDDDSEMRAARRAALEIEWCDTMTEQGFLPVPSRDTLKKIGVWSSDEHERYCAALKLYRYGSWSQIAKHVGSRTERQVSSHAQSIRAKRKRGEERQFDRNNVISSQKLKANPTSTSGSRNPFTTIKLASSMSRPTPTFAEILRTTTSGPVPSLENSGGSSNLTAPVKRPSDDMKFTFFPVPKRDVIDDLGSSNRLGIGAEEQAACSSHLTKGELTKANGEENFHRSQKRSKPNPHVDAHATPLCSSPLDDLLEMLLGDEDLLEPLDLEQV